MSLARKRLLRVEARLGFKLATQPARVQIQSAWRRAASEGTMIHNCSEAHS